MRKEITEKLHMQYLQEQKVKLEGDTFYQHLIKKMHTALAYAVPVITIQNGIMTQEVPETFEWAKAELDSYMDLMYPYLKGKPMKFSAWVPWDHAYISAPEALNLDQIDARLNLFKYYLEYRIQSYRIIEWFLDHCKSTGTLNYYPSETVLEFDEWLYVENYRELVNIIWGN